MAGRPPSKQPNWIEVQDYKFNADDEIEKSLARYLLQAPKGTVRTRMKRLMLDGVNAHRQSLGHPLLEDAETMSASRKTTTVLKFYFDRANPLERECYDFIRRAEVGKRKARTAKLLRLGYEYRKTSQPTKQTES